MFRFLAIFLVTCVIGAFVAHQAGLIPEKMLPWNQSSRPKEGETQETKADAGPRRHPQLGNPLFEPAPRPEEPKLPDSPLAADPIVIHGSMSAMDKLDVPSVVSGQILFVGEEVPEGVAQVAGVAPFLQEPFQYAFVEQGNRDVAKVYRRIFEGETIRDDQMVAMVNPAKALNGVLEKQAKHSAAAAEEEAARKVDEEAERRLRIEERIKNGSELDLSNARLTRIKTYQEFVAKKEAVKVARIELDMAEILLKQHEIRNKLPQRNCQVKSIFKNRGEAVKELEPVMQAYRLDQLVAEALVEVQFVSRLKQRKSNVVTIEPTREEAPLRVFRGHKAEINAVAILADPMQPLILSASEDGTIGVWSRSALGTVASLRCARTDEADFPDPVRALTTVPGGKIVVGGCSDGSLHIWDLAQNGKKIGFVGAAHRDAVTALAASPDGKYLASGSTDGSIHLWSFDPTKIDEPKTNSSLWGPYRSLPIFEAGDGAERGHQGYISQLTFTPQCTLISASKDNTIRIWNLHEKGVKLARSPIGGRSGTVQHLGVSADGRWMMFDQAKILQLLSVADGRTVNTLQATSGAVPFDTLALLTPDASLLLTAGLAEGRLQLWKTPTQTERGYEVRQYVTQERAAVTCAAFSPSEADGASRFIVSGAKDGNVFVWSVPNAQEVRDHRIAGVLTMVHNAQEAGIRQVRITVEVPNPQGRLVPGRPVTIVAD